MSYVQFKDETGSGCVILGPQDINGSIKANLTVLIPPHFRYTEQMEQLQSTQPASSDTSPPQHVTSSQQHVTSSEYEQVLAERDLLAASIEEMRRNQVC